MAGGLGWHYRGKIADKLGLVAQKPSDASLLAFNNEKFEVLNDSLIVAGCDSSVSILFLGNSLTYCGVADEDPDKTKRGLTYTTIDKDYVHRLVQMISERDSASVRYSVTNIAEFERQFHLRPFPWDDKLSDAMVQRPDILIVQMGENASTDAITEVALRTRSGIADLSHLGHRNSDPRNFAKYYRHYSNPGVGEHPSDYGFEQIAKMLLVATN